MSTLALSLPSTSKVGFSSSPAPIDSAAPMALIFQIQNPGEDPMAFIVAPPLPPRGPYYTCQELQEAYDELKAAGDIR